MKDHLSATNVRIVPDYAGCPFNTHGSIPWVEDLENLP